MISRKGIVEIEVTCRLSEDDFKPWDELTPKQQEEQAYTNMGCEGTGEFGALCVSCHFCSDWEIVDAYKIQEGRCDTTRDV